MNECGSAGTEDPIEERLLGGGRSFNMKKPGRHHLGKLRLYL